MNQQHTSKLPLAMSLLALSAVPSSALVIMISDLSPAGSSIENFFNNNFTNVTEIRHADYSNFSAAASQDALNGTGAFAGNGPADIFVIGRSLSSPGYQGGVADGYNAISIPFINFTSYTARSAGNRLGWHTGSVSTGQLVAGAETTVTAAGGSLGCIAAGAHDILVNGTGTPAVDTFNAAAAGTTGFGGGTILSTIGPDTHAAIWQPGAAPGDPTSAGVATFPGVRLLWNLDNDPNAGNDGTNDFTNLTPLGRDTLTCAIAAATDLVAVPEPSTGFLGLFGLGMALRRRR